MSMTVQDYTNFEALEFASNYGSKNPVIRFLLKRFDAHLISVLESVRPHIRTVLEVGSGEGYSTDLIRKAILPTTMLASSDLIPELVRRSRERAGDNNNFVQNLHSLAVRSKSVDLVVALEVMEHLPSPSNALEEIARVTRRWAIVSIPYEPWWRIGNMLRGAHWSDWGNTPDHVNHWGKASFSRFLRQRFDKVEVRVSFPWLIACCEQPLAKETTK
jgi:SAM-dependent methyltransferase